MSFSVFFTPLEKYFFAVNFICSLIVVCIVIVELISSCFHPFASIAVILGLMKEIIFSIQISEAEEEAACPPSPASAKVGTTLEVEEEGCRLGSRTGKQKRRQKKFFFFFYFFENSSFCHKNENLLMTELDCFAPKTQYQKS